MHRGNAPATRHAFVANSERARAVLGWRPRCHDDLSTIVAHAVAWELQAHRARRQMQTGHRQGAERNLSSTRTAVPAADSKRR